MSMSPILSQMLVEGTAAELLAAQQSSALAVGFFYATTDLPKKKVYLAAAVDSLVLLNNEDAANIVKSVSNTGTIPLSINAQGVLSATVALSTNSGNRLTFGTDGKLFVAPNTNTLPSTENSNSVILSNSNGKLKADTKIDNATDNELKVNAAGLYVKKVKIHPDSSNVLSIDAENRIAFNKHVITDIHVAATITSLANFITAYNTKSWIPSAGKELGTSDIVMLNGNTQNYWFIGTQNPATVSAADFITIEGLDGTSAQFRALLSATGSVVYNPTTGEFSFAISADNGNVLTYGSDGKLMLHNSALGEQEIFVGTTPPTDVTKENKRLWRNSVSNILNYKEYRLQTPNWIPIRRKLTLKDFGAVGNGLVDDSTAIQNYITYLQNVGEKTLLLDAGTYMCSINLPSNISLVGDNTILVGNAAVEPIITCAEDVSEVSIKNITFSNSEYGIYIPNYSTVSESISVENCYFTDITQSAISVSKVWGFNVHKSTFENCKVDVSIEASCQRVQLIGNNHIANTTVLNTDCAISLSGNSTNLVELITIDNVTINKTGGCGVFINNASNVCIKNSSFYDCYDAIILTANNNSNVEVLGNKFKNTTLKNSIVSIANVDTLDISKNKIICSNNTYGIVQISSNFEQVKNIVAQKNLFVGVITGGLYQLVNSIDYAGFTMTLYRDTTTFKNTGVVKNIKDITNTSNFEEGRVIYVGIETGILTLKHNDGNIVTPTAEDREIHPTEIAVLVWALNKWHLVNIISATSSSGGGGTYTFRNGVFDNGAGEISLGGSLSDNVDLNFANKEMYLRNGTLKIASKLYVPEYEIDSNGFPTNTTTGVWRELKVGVNDNLYYDKI